MKRLCVIAIFAVLHLALGFAVKAATKLDSVYAHWWQMPTDSLYHKGLDFNNQHHEDSALICFTICADRPVSSMSTQEKSLVVKSLTMSARLYFRFFEYGKAYEQLAKAMTICGDKDMGDCMTGVYMEQGALLMTYAHQKPDSDNFSRAEQAYRKAFWSALKYEQWESLQTAFFNLGNYLYGTHRLSDMRKELDAFIQAPIPSDRLNYDYMRSFHHGLCHILNGDHVKAREAFRKQLTQVADTKHANIYKFEAYTALVKSFAFENKIDSAIHYELIMHKLAVDTHMKDGEVVTARDLATFYQQLGDTAMSARYSDLALRGKDTLLAVNDLDKVSALDFVSQLLKQEARYQRQERLSQWLGAVLISVLVILAALFAFWWFYKRRSNAEPENVQPEAPTVKYQNSSLSEEEKKMLQARIKQILENNDVVYEQSFCLNLLAELCESNPKYISQVINELYGHNFTTLVSSLRVKEACRRMADKANYGNLSLEGIAFSVGFKSRVTMYQAFKKVMGMTPTEYQNSL